MLVRTDYSGYHSLYLLTVLVMTAVLSGSCMERNTPPPAGESVAVQPGEEIRPEPVEPRTEPNPVRLQETVRALDSLAPLSSLLIQRKGEVVVEEYFGSMRAGRLHNVKSVSKGLLSILIGIAIDRGYLEGVDQQIGPFFSDWFDENPDPEKEAITIGDLLTMRSGLASTSGRNYGPWVVSRNWIHHALNRPLVGRPGHDRIYSTGTTHLLGVILSRASGMSLRQFANRYLFDPMDIRLGGWDRDPQDYYMGGNNMALRPRDLLKVGELMMNVGSWEGEQLVSREWVIRSVQRYTGRGNRMNYGYLWFRRMSGEYDVVYAWGNGGQFLKIIPELEMVIAITSWEGAGATRQSRFALYEYLDEEIIPMVATGAGMDRDEYGE